jgi:membrane-associated phospholipid phosphatase
MLTTWHDAEHSVTSRPAWRRVPGPLRGPVLLLGGTAASILVVTALGWVLHIPAAETASRHVWRWFLHHRVPRLNHHVNQLTRMGDYQLVIPASLIAGTLLTLWRRSLVPVVVVAGSVWLERAAQGIVTHLVHSPMPDAGLTIGKPGAYPSGGSARVVLLLGLILYFALREHPVAWRIGTAVVVVAAVVEGWTRLYLGRHWMGDLVGGWLLGAGLLLTLVALAEWAGPGRPWAGAGERSEADAVGR